MRDGHAQSAQAEVSLSRLWASQPRASDPQCLSVSSAVRRLCTPIKNAAVCVASPARLASLASPCPVGSKKSSSASSFMDNLGGSRPRGCHFHHAGTLSAVVVCAQKSARLLDLDCPLPKEPSSGRLCRWRSEPARRVNGYGRPFQTATVLVTATRISGPRIRQ